MQQIPQIDRRATGFKSRIFRVLGDPTRLGILELLRGGELCQCEILPLLEKSQPTLSRHLGILEEAGLICSRRDANRVLYRIADEGIYRILDSIDEELVNVITGEISGKLPG